MRDDALAVLGRWHWAATFGSLDPIVDDPDIRTRYRATDRVDLTRIAGALPMTVSDHQGRYRRRQTPAIVTLTSTVTWHAVADPGRLEELLAPIGFIGKHRGVGEGHVSSWTITASDRSWWSAGHEYTAGLLGRTVLPDCLDGHPDTVHGPQSLTGLRPPYLHPSRRTPAIVPA